MANQYTPEALAYNTVGLRPVECTYNIDPKMLCDKIEEICRQNISDLYKVTFRVDKKHGIVAWYAWFPSNCDHFVYKGSANTALGRGIKANSKEFTEFAQRFGWRPADDDPEHGSGSINLKEILDKNVNPEIATKYTSLQLAITPFLMIIFDLQGAEFKKEFGKNAPKMVLTRHYLWREGGGEKHHSLVGVEVKKTLKNLTMDREDLIPSKSGRFN